MDEAIQPNNYPAMSPPEQNHNSIKERLDPSLILFEIQKKLQGGYQRMFIDDTTGKIKHEWVTTGKKLLNDEGIQKVMSHASSIINQATVLGYFKDTGEKTRFFLFWKKNLRRELYVNKYDYGIDDATGVNHILITISSFADLFLTRLIGRKEAEALEKTYNVVENVQTDNQKGLNLGFRRN